MKPPQEKIPWISFSTLHLPGNFPCSIRSSYFHLLLQSDNETCRPPIVISDMEFTNNSSKDTFVGPSHMRIDDLQLQAENKV